MLAGEKDHCKQLQTTSERFKLLGSVGYLGHELWVFAGDPPDRLVLTPWGEGR